jgi:hypothetical protein
MIKSSCILIFCLSITSYSQIQLGEALYGENAEDEFGVSISLSDNGTIMAVSAIYHDGNGTDSGQVRIFQNTGGSWSQIGQDINGEHAGDASGMSVSLNGDGSIVAIGARWNDGNGNDSGHVRVYQNNNNTWTQIGQDIDGESPGDQSGMSISLSADGSIVAIGAWLNGGNGHHSGHVRVFGNNAGIWTQIGEDIDGQNTTDICGRTVVLNATGNIVAVGSTGNTANTDGNGEVRVFQNTAGTWTQIGQTMVGDATIDDFGYAIKLSSDGNIIAIGAQANDGNGTDSGQVKIFRNSSGTWTQIGQDIYGEAPGDRAGFAVGFSGDGSIVAVGAPFNNNNGQYAGHVKLYANRNDAWEEIGEAIEGEASDDHSGLGLSINEEGTTVAIGSTYSNGNGYRSGQVRVFDISGLLHAPSIIPIQCALYPNPASTACFVQLAPTNTLLDIRIFNTNGQLVKTTKTPNINIADLPSGTYFMHLRSEAGEAIQELIVN